MPVIVTKHVYLSIIAYDLDKHETGMSVLSNTNYIFKIDDASYNVNLSNTQIVVQDASTPTITTTNYLTTTYTFLSTPRSMFLGVDSELE